MLAQKYKERVQDGNENKSLFFLLWTGVLLVILSFVLAGGVIALDDDKTIPSARKRLVIKSNSGAKITVTKAELSRRPKADHAEALPSRRAAPAANDPVPTQLRLYFPTLVYPGDDVKGRLWFNDPDDYVFSIFITVIFPDGDVVTESLYDYRIDGGDIWKGNYSFWIELPESETPLPGKIIITCSDEYLNVTEVTQNFVLMY